MIENIFRNKVANIKNLLSYGFKSNEYGYFYSVHLSDNQFEMTVEITEKGKVSTKVIDLSLQEEYTLFKVANACGNFVGKIREKHENVLLDICEKCFDVEIFKSEYAKLIIEYMKNKYQTNPEYLWEKFPNNAIFRRCDNPKWYAALLTLKKSKLGFDSDEEIEIIDLKGRPEFIAEFVDGVKYFSGYHMNKKHWFTICLDGSVPIDEIFSKIDASYGLAK